MSTTDTTRADWLADRKLGMGASDIAKADSGRYGGAVSVVADKLGMAPDDEIDHELADRGHRWEPALADGVRAHLGGYVVAGEQMRLTHRSEPRWFCTADGLLVPDGAELTMAAVEAGCEFKTRGPGAPWAWDYWTTQAQWSCMVADLPRWLLAIGTVDTDYDTTTGQMVEQLTNVTYRWVMADPMEQARLVELAESLWAHVERGELPDPTGPEALPYVKLTNRVGGQICPECNGTGKYSGPNKRRKHCPTCDGDGRSNIDTPPVLGDELSELVARREAIAAAIAASAAEYDTIEAKLRAAIGQATEVQTADGAWRVRCGLPIRKFTSQSEADWLALHAERGAELGLVRTVTVLDRERFKAELPDEYDAYRIETPDRRLTVKNLRPEDPTP